MQFTEETFDIYTKGIILHIAENKNIPAMDRRIYGDPYTEIYHKWRSGSVPPVSKKQYETIFRHLKTIYRIERATGIMDQLKAKKVLYNPALVQFLIDYGAKSPAFIEALLVAPAISILRTAFGQKVDGSPILLSDPFWWWGLREPMFMFAYFRSHVAAENITGNTVTIPGIGYAPELYVLEKQSRPLPSRITACDIDPEVIRWIEIYATTMAMRGRLDFRPIKIGALLDEIDCDSQDSISMLGVASYCVDTLPVILPKVMSRLKPGGTLILDLQVLEWSLARCVSVFGWQMPDFTPSRTAEDAISVIENATKSIPLASAKYYIDPRIDDPIGVVFVLQKA